MANINDIYRGDTKEYTVTITENGSPKDLTDCIVKMMFKDQLSDEDTEAALNVNADIPDPLLGIANITLDSSDTKIDPKEYLWIIVLLKPSIDYEKTLLQGQVTIIERVYKG